MYVESIWGENNVPKSINKELKIQREFRALIEGQSKENKTKQKLKKKKKALSLLERLIESRAFNKSWH